MPRGVPYSHLTNAPWSLVYTTPEWVMIMVSIANTEKWIDLAKSTGALSWLRGHNMTYIYEWYEPALDENGLEIRPPNPMGATEGRRSDFNTQKKKYDREALIDDIRAQLMTYEQMSDKYGITRQTIYSIQKRAGIDSPRLKADRGKPRKQYDRDALVADIKANQLTYHELGLKYGLQAISVQRIARVEGLTKPRQRRKVNE
jgi:transposase